jgi:hypothetical protein
MFHIIIYNYELKIITGYLNTHRNFYTVSQKWRLIHYLILFSSHNINACLTFWHRNFFIFLAHPVYKM